jgi:hypothetical protein
MNPVLPRTGADADSLNDECFCISLNAAALEQALESGLGQPGLFELVRQRCPYLFAARPVFVAASHIERMAGVVRAVESVIALPAYREEVLARAPASARIGAVGPTGVFLGYDFHLAQGRLGLIEINTNAGGALMNAVLARAQRACCAEVERLVPSVDDVVTFERRIVEMFRNEWRLAGHATPLASIAIVDEAPEEQFLFAEFLMFERLFELHGIRAVIADPRSLSFRAGRLWHEYIAIDLVYNRLTDFYLEGPACSALREAFEHNAVVLTPHPRAHALYADKRNLELLSDAARLQDLGVPASMREILVENVPRTIVVKASYAERLWSERRSLFFKPVAGFGSRAAYRGDKLTRRVWQDILAGDYVAQAIVTPGERVIDADNAARALKFDLRNYVYEGAVQWAAARLYQGQTTNFRTPGGGFAPVYSTADVADAPVPCQSAACHESLENP